MVKSLVLFWKLCVCVFEFVFFSAVRTHQIIVNTKMVQENEVGCENLFRNSYSCVDDWRWLDGFIHNPCTNSLLTHASWVMAWESKKINTLVKYLLIHSECCYSCRGQKIKQNQAENGSIQILYPFVRSMAN